MITFRKHPTYTAETLEELLLSNDMTDAIDDSNGYARVNLERLDFAAVVETFGADRASLAYLGSLSREHIGPPVANYPPVVFISYRRLDDQIVDWTTRLAEHLQVAGYGVLLDEISTEDAESGIREGIPRFMSQLHRANVFLPIVTSGYTRGTARPWIHAEREIAWLRTLDAKMDIVNVLLDDVELPDVASHFFPLVDLRDDRDNFSAVVEQLPKIERTLSDQEAADLNKLLKACHALMSGNNHQEIIRLIKESVFANLYECREFLCIAHAMQNQNDEALRYMDFDDLRAQRSRRRRLEFCEQLLKAGSRGEALRFLWPMFRDFGTDNAALAHLIAGEALENADSLQASANHYQATLGTTRDPAVAMQSATALVAILLKMSQADAADSVLESIAGGTDMITQIVVGTVREQIQQENLFEAQDIVNVSLRKKRGKNREPIHLLQTPRHLHLVCSVCTATYIIDPSEERICSLCGALYQWSIPDHSFGHCPHCCYTGCSPLPLLQQGEDIICPICRTGVMDIKNTNA